MKKDFAELSDAVASEATSVAKTTVENFKHQAQNLQKIVSPDVEKKEALGSQKIESAEAVDSAAVSEANSSINEDRLLGFDIVPALSSLSQSGQSWMKAFVDTVKSLAEEDTTSNEHEHTEVIRPRSHSTSPDFGSIGRLPHHVLYSIQTDRNTFLSAPAGSADGYDEWLKLFRLEDHDKEISEMLRTCPPMRAIYQELVPSKVSNLEFWQRYFYKVLQAIVIEENKMASNGERNEKGTKVRTNKETKLDQQISAKIKTELDSSTTSDETWSVCSSVNIDAPAESRKEELDPQTPHAHSSDEMSQKSTKGSDDWIDWEEG
ncbi:hypothetical protein AB6A40_008321 [Gnathostoma spinigerum]|uniref:BSD domain-containing protein n=1 Tax=Gnathostoma spinigerum TaxID=75299 RepID=A0ABD6ER41_9BILA